MPTIEWNKKAWTNNFKKFKSTPERPFYGDGWGRPEDNWYQYMIKKYILRKKVPGNLAKVVKQYIRPYMDPGKRVMEIGSGGGRWTQYLLEAKELVVVEINSIFFSYLKERFPGAASRMSFYNTGGYEMRGIDTASIDFVFTFGTFVHVEPEGIHEYLGEIKRVLKPGSTAVVQYADKTKKRARELRGFTNMNPAKMEAYIKEHEFHLVQHDTRLLSHSNIAVIRK